MHDFDKIDKAFISDTIAYYKVKYPEKNICQIIEKILIDFNLELKNIVAILKLMPDKTGKMLTKIEFIEVQHLENMLKKGMKPYIISNSIKQLFKAYPDKFKAYPKTKQLIQNEKYTN
jgi:uncharacterized protein (DUF433 family)